MAIVKIKNMGSFNARAGQTLLEAARGHGIILPSDCASGNCGTCKVQVTNGQGEFEILEHDAAVLSALERQHGKTLACRTVVRGDIEVEPGEPLVEPRRLRGRVVGLERLPDLVRLTIAPEQPLPFQPGQYVKLSFGKVGARSYSMANLPGEELLEFHVRHRHGPGSRHVQEQMQVGDRVGIDGPYGLCVFKPAVEIVAAVNGVGFAPLKSIVNAALAARQRPQLRLVWGLRAAANVYEPETVAAWRAAGVSVRFAFSRPCADTRRLFPTDGDVASYAQARLDGWLRRRPPHPDAIAYVCGSPAMVTAAQGVAERHGIRTILADSFAAAEPLRPSWRGRLAGLLRRG